MTFQRSAYYRHFARAFVLGFFLRKNAGAHKKAKTLTKAAPTQRQLLMQRYTSHLRLFFCFFTQCGEAA